MDIEEDYDFTLLETITILPKEELPYQLIETLESQKEGNITIKTSTKTLDLVIHEENSNIELPLLQELTLEPTKIYFEKIRVRFDKIRKFI